MRNKIILSLILAACLVLPYSSRHRSANMPLDPDEPVYVYYSSFFKPFFLGHKRVFSFCSGSLKYSAVMGGVFITGFVAHLSGIPLPEEPQTIAGSGRENFKDWLAGMEQLFPQIRSSIKAMRAKMFVFRSGYSAVAAGLAYLAGGTLFSLFTAFFILTDSTLKWFSGLVLLESIWVFLHLFNVLLICLFLYLWQRNTGKLSMTLLAACAITGISAGLLASVKINGGVNIFIFAFALALLLPLHFGRKVPFFALRNSILYVCLAMGLALLVFVLLDPCLYQHPFYGMRQILQERLNIFDLQAASAGGRNVTLSAAERMRWAIEECLFWPRTVKQVAPRGVITALGCVLFYGAFFRMFVQKKVNVPLLVVGTAFLLEMCSILLFMKVSYPRYSTIMHPYFAIFSGYFLLRLSLVLSGILRRKKHDGFKNT